MASRLDPRIDWWTGQGHCSGGSWPASRRAESERRACQFLSLLGIPTGAVGHRQRFEALERSRGTGSAARRYLSPRSNRNLRHLVPCPALKLATSALLVDATPLLEEKGDLRAPALVADAQHPLSVHRPRSRSRLSAYDDPVDPVEIQAPQRAQERFLTLQPHMLELPLRWKKPQTVFVNSRHAAPPRGRGRLVVHGGPGAPGSPSAPFGAPPPTVVPMLC